jgi:pyruvate/2-oxoacid:ferredoxin oxidoreductase beta subunit
MALKPAVLGLEMRVAEGGSNFSSGQRQLICFGCAMLNTIHSAFREKMMIVIVLGCTRLWRGTGCW